MVKIPKWLKDRGYDNVPTLYKDLGLDAAESYLRMKKKGKSTKHWTLPYGDFKYVFFDCISKVKVLQHIRYMRMNTSKRFPWDPVLNMWSLNKPLNYKYRR